MSVHMNSLLLGDWTFFEAWVDGYQYGFDASRSVDGWIILYQDRVDVDGSVVVVSQLAWKTGVHGL